jgi:transcriptional regulator with XRE-family HTH domain
MSDHQAGCPCPSSSPVPTGDDLTENCESCGETTRDAPDVAPVLPAEFWEQPQIRSALLNRHFGCFLRTYRTSQSPHIKQTQLARWLGITQGQLSRIERSATPIGDLAKLHSWAQRLRIPPDQLWFSPSAPAVRHAAEPAPQRAIVDYAPHSEVSDMRRRDRPNVASVAATVASAGLLSDTPWQRLIDSVNKGRSVDTATVQLMQDRTADLVHTEESVPARQLLEAFAQHRATLETLLANAGIESLQETLRLPWVKRMS